MSREVWSEPRVTREGSLGSWVGRFFERAHQGNGREVGLLILLGCSLSGIWANAEEGPKALSLGVQAGLALPLGNDLKITTGSGLNPALGIHATWEFRECHAVRPRVDLWTFSRGHQDVVSPQIQRIDTKVQGLSLGAEYLFRPGGRQGRWAVGAGLYLIRWSVESTNQLAFPSQGSAQGAGTSQWTREGLGLVGAYRLTPHLEAEAQWIFSHYGYENLRVNLGTLGLLWRF